MEQSLPDDILNPMRELVSQLSGLGEQAVGIYAPIVEQIILTSDQNEKHIEHTLDWMLSYCFSPEMLDLYKKLCRYYFTINAVATAGYIEAYREMWDSEEIYDEA